jgi:hypothetical protein
MERLDELSHAHSDAMGDPVREREELVHER